MLDPQSFQVRIGVNWLTRVDLDLQSHSLMARGSPGLTERPGRCSESVQEKLCSAMLPVSLEAGVMTQFASQQPYPFFCST